MCSTNSASSIRGQCVEHTDYAFCVCPCFLPAGDETRQYPNSDNVVPAYHCTCGHGIHAHVDYLSPVVHHCPSTHCAAYVQRTPRTQDCTCGAPLADHVAIVNSYRLPAAISYAGGIQNICPPSSTIGPGNPSDNMNIILSPQPIAFSPSPNIYPSGTQQGTIQEEADVSSCHQGPSGIFKGDSDENGHFHDLNAMYGVTSVPGALAGFSA